MSINKKIKGGGTVLIASMDLLAITMFTALWIYLHLGI
tara:strand:- start:1044 stop:1157 length:114 start_codon:yes stop_codon:yes gene_type:complete